ncbi:MAG TPA: PQQ-dependent sugar dehydrogenase [Solirubrobacteraceae bacterium]|nr:PQQ-dependent sugar dehydrogenase [Solirubrobacteraceae bacterium]
MRTQGEPEVSAYTSGLVQPWELVFLPGGGALVTERPGRVRVLNARGEITATALTKDVGGGEGGTLGLALDPRFTENALVYLYRTLPDQAGNQVLRYTWSGERLTDEQIVVGDIPASSIHDGGRLRFGPDGFLYITTGDAGQPALAQDRSSRAGKVLRLPPAGYRGGGEGLEQVSLGHRNPQGLDFEPGTNRLYATEHGPADDDEINLIVPGGNFGWPSQVGPDHAEGFQDPLVTYTPSLAPSGATFVRQPGSTWSGDFLVGGLAGQRVQRLRFDGRRVLIDEELFRGRFGRIRDVVEGPDGALYLLTANGDDRVLRVVPPASAPAQPPPSNQPERPVAQDAGGVGLDAFGGVLAWSAFDPAVKAWRLIVQRGGGTPQPAAIAPRPVPFDLDLGPGEDGGVVAVYSRCARESLEDGGGGAIEYARGRGCDVFRLDLAPGGEERRLARASTKEASEFLPSIWKDSVAFARVYERRGGRRGDLPYLYVRSLDGGRSERQPAGGRGQDGLPGPTGLDLYGRRLAFTWEWRERDRLRSELRLDTVGGDHRLIDRIGSRSAPANLFSPVAERGRVYAGSRRVRGTQSTDRVLRHRISTRDNALAALALDGGLVALALDDGRFAATVAAEPGATPCAAGPPAGRCSIVALGKLSFSDDAR